MAPADMFIHRFMGWAAARPDVQAAALVGSHARGTASEDSDIDLVILTGTPERFLSDQGWIAAFGEVRQHTREDWGAVQSLRVFYVDGPEVEFGITTPSGLQPIRSIRAQSVSFATA